jgi:putative ABC transport system permease protein
MGELLVLAVAGVAAGTAVMLAVTRIIQSMLFGIGASDAATYAAVAVVLAGALFLAAYFPSRRAMHVDPVIALRAE